MVSDEVLNEREGLHVLTMKLKEEKEMAIEGLRTKHQNEIETLKKVFSEQTKVEVNQGMMNFLFLFLASYAERIA